MTTAERTDQGTRKIDATLISAMKSGSTYLQGIFLKHPEVYLSRAAHTDTTVIPDMKDYQGEKLVMVRRNMKPHADQAQIYRTANQNMKFIMLVRNPVDRAFSQFVHHVNKHTKMKKVINVHPAAVQRNIYDINKDIEVRRSAYENNEVGWVKKSLFYNCLSPYLDLFPGENFFVVPLKIFGSDPQHWFDRMCDFLGVSRLENISGLDKVVNAGRYKASVLNRMTRRKTPEFIKPTDETKQFLTGLFRDDARKLGDVIGMDVVSIWNLK